MAFQPGQSGNPAGRPKGSVNKQRAMLLDAVEKVLPLVVDRALAGDHEAQKLILEKGLPKLKAVEAPMEFTLPEAGEASPARAILIQVAEGALPLPHAKEILTSLLPEFERQARPAIGQQTSAGVMNAYLSSLMDTKKE